MIPKLPLVFVLTMLLSVVGEAQVKSDRDRANLVGAVRTVSERSYRFMGPTDYKKDDKDEAKSGDTVTYDRLGNEIERVMVSDFGEAMGNETSTRDAAGRIKETVWRNPKGGVIERKLYVYSAEILTEILRYDGKAVLREKIGRVYDSSDRLTEEVYYDPDVARGKTAYTHDQKGNAIETAFFLAGGQKAIAPVGPCLGAHRVTMTYNTESRPITRAVYEPDGDLKKSWAYTYNDRGSLATQTITSGSDISQYSFRYEYDARGNWIKSTIIVETDSSANSLLKMMEALENSNKEKSSVEETQRLADQLKITTVSTREITYY